MRSPRGQAARNGRLGTRQKNEHDTRTASIDQLSIGPLESRTRDEPVLSGIEASFNPFRDVREPALAVGVGASYVNRMSAPAVMPDSAEPTVRRLSDMLRETGMGAKPGVMIGHQFCVTDASEKFTQIASRFLGGELSGCVSRLEIG